MYKVNVAGEVCIKMFSLTVSYALYIVVTVINDSEVVMSLR